VPRCTAAGWRVRHIPAHLETKNRADLCRVEQRLISKKYQESVPALLRRYSSGIELRYVELVVRTVTSYSRFVEAYSPNDHPRGRWIFYSIQSGQN
jgi:hypothetical protein